MKVHKHKDYGHYSQSQINANLSKLKRVWATDEEISAIVNYLNDNPIDSEGRVPFGICHGARNGWEVDQLIKRLGNFKVIGTDISHTAKRFPNMIQWDFHKIKDEWVNNVDFIYTNSLDHCYDPKLCVDTWMKCIRNPGGTLFLEWHDNAGHTDPVDCFTADMDEIRGILSDYNIVKEIAITRHVPAENRTYIAPMLVVQHA